MELNPTVDLAVLAMAVRIGEASRGSRRVAGRATFRPEGSGHSRAGIVGIAHAGGAVSAHVHVGPGTVGGKTAVSTRTTP